MRFNLGITRVVRECGYACTTCLKRSHSEVDGVVPILNKRWMGNVPNVCITKCLGGSSKENVIANRGFVGLLAIRAISTIMSPPGESNWGFS